MENENYILRGHCWLDAIFITTYIQQYVDMTVGLKNDENHHEVGG